jgi:two-component system nitrogen regulation response regulator NtrX
MTRILVVDDDRTTRHLLGGVLTKAGFKTTVAKDGAEALEALRHGRFDLMLLDVWMPKLNGLELLEHIQAWKRRPRVVVMTSDDAPQTLLEAVRQQAFRYIHKPYNRVANRMPGRRNMKAQDLPPKVGVSAGR